MTELVVLYLLIAVVGYLIIRSALSRFPWYVAVGYSAMWPVVLVGGFLCEWLARDWVDGLIKEYKEKADG